MAKMTKEEMQAEVTKINKEVEEKKATLKVNEAIVFVDGSYQPDDNPDVVGFSWIEFIKYDSDSNYIEHKNADTNSEPKYVSQRNVGAEVLAAEHAIRSALLNKITHLDIYADYIGLINFVDGSWKADTIPTIEYAEMVKQAKDKITIVFHKVPAAHDLPKNEGVTDNMVADALARDVIPKKSK